MPEPIALGSRRELFVDSLLIDRLDGVRQRLHEPERRGYVLEVLPPHENACTGCYNLVDDGDAGLLLYYRGFYPIGATQADGHTDQTCNVALSPDGVHFKRPDLGLFPVDPAGGAAPNTVWKGYEAHNFCVFVDGNPKADPQARFKAVGGGMKNRLYGFQSADGIHWQRLQDEPLAIEGRFDSVNVPLWDAHAGCYRLFSRYLHERDGEGIRAIQSCTSDDFVHWSTPEPHDYGDVPHEHFYTNATIPCPGAEHLLLSFPMRFLPDRTLDPEILDSAGMEYPQKGLSDAVFLSSRDGVHWDRTFRQAWLRPGRDRRNWTHRNQTPAVGIVETGADEWSMYVAEHYGWNDNRLRRVTVRPWGFASLCADVHGEALTPPVTFDGRRLSLNLATSAAGSVRVELQDAEGRALPGFSLDEAVPLYGDTLDATARWQSGEDLSGLQGQALRLRFVLEDADLYSLQFV
jgi:hypothetical protein